MLTDIRPVYKYVLLLCNGDIAKWSNSFCTVRKNKKLSNRLVQTRAAVWQQIKAISFQDYNLGGEKCLEKLMFFIYCWLYICIICYILAAKNEKEGVMYD